MKRTKKLVLSALMIAFVYVATLISIGPLPPSNGYVHLGDALVLLAGFVLGPVYGGIVGAVGSFLADISLGYAAYAPGTFVVKFLVAFTAGLMYSLKDKGSLRPVIASVVSEIIMVAGYYIYEAFLLGGGIGAVVALSAVPSNIFQGVAAIVIAVLITSTFKNNKSIKKFLGIKEYF